MLIIKVTGAEGNFKLQKYEDTIKWCNDGITVSIIIIKFTTCN